MKALAMLLAVCMGCEAIDDFGAFHVVDVVDGGADAAKVGVERADDDLAMTSSSLDLVAFDDMTAIDASSDLALLPDLVSPPDFVSSPDLASPPDLAPSPDLASPPDLTPFFSPSCRGLARTCGPNKNGDCCESPFVTGGMFFRSYDGTVDFSDKNYPARVSGFRLDRYEVTVGRFRKALDAGVGTQGNLPANGAGANSMIGTGWDPRWNQQLLPDINAQRPALKCDPNHQTWTDVPGVNESLPINCVNWFEAFAFCVWDGGRLPTEAEWNYAASGGAEQRAYPWANPPVSTVIDDSYAVYCGGLCAIQAVGAKSPKGDGKWGHSDLAGNVWEWVFDWYASPYGNPCVDCANVMVTNNRVLRGGHFAWPAANLRNGVRPNAVPTNRDNGAGFRCARAL